MKKISRILLLLTACILCACSAQKPADKASSSEVPASAPGASAPAAAETVTFSDALGRDVTIPKNPKRTAALLGSFAQMWELAGGSVIAAPADAWEDYGLSKDGIEDLGDTHEPSTEALLAADPDFVIASASTSSNVEMKDTLESAEIPVAYFDVDNFTDYLAMLDVLTDITDRKDLYKKNGSDLEAEIDQIKAEYTDTAQDNDERKVLMLRAASNAVKAKGSEGTILGEMLADLGCINIADSDKSLLENLSVETVIREQPEHIFVVTMGNDTDAALAMLDTVFQENPAWNELDAVKNGRLHIMDKTLFNMKPNDRWPEAYKKLLETLTADA